MQTRAIPRLDTALAGRYAIEREIGRGGMATVYLARDLRHHRPVAIKVLEPELGALLGAELADSSRAIERAALLRRTLEMQPVIGSTAAMAMITKGPPEIAGQRRSLGYAGRVRERGDRAIVRYTTAQTR